MNKEDADEAFRDAGIRWIVRNMLKTAMGLAFGGLSFCISTIIINGFSPAAPIIFPFNFGTGIIIGISIVIGYLSYNNRLINTS